jgi:nitrate/nitrite-specific signal transduction histidine kinase
MMTKELMERVAIYELMREKADELVESGMVGPRIATELAKHYADIKKAVQEKTSS